MKTEHRTIEMKEEKKGSNLQETSESVIHINLRYAAAC